MALQFAKNEKVVRTYDYARVGLNNTTSKYATEKSLIVTNKRVIHQEICEKAGRNIIVRQEMPLSQAKNVNVTYAKVVNFKYLVACIIFAVLGLIAICLPAKAMMPAVPSLLPLLGFAMLLVAVIMLICFLASMKAVLSCVISSDQRLQPVIGVYAKSLNPDSPKAAKKKDQLQIIVSVDTKVAKELADELGAVILNASEGVYADDADMAEAEASAEDSADQYTNFEFPENI